MWNKEKFNESNMDEERNYDIDGGGCDNESWTDSKWAWPLGIWSQSGFYSDEWRRLSIWIIWCAGRFLSGTYRWKRWHGQYAGQPSPEWSGRASYWWKQWQPGRRSGNLDRRRWSHDRSDQRSYSSSCRRWRRSHGYVKWWKWRWNLGRRSY